MEKVNILVVAKDQKIIEKIKDCFLEDGHQVIPAYDVPLGFFLAQKNFPEIILCEPQLKEGDVWTMLGELQSDPELEPIPFVVIDNSEGKLIDEKVALDNGISEYVELHYTNEKMIETLVPLIKRRLSQKEDRPMYSPE